VVCVVSVGVVSTPDGVSVPVVAVCVCTEGSIVVVSVEDVVASGVGEPIVA
jgi:hypothetical protein